MKNLDAIKARISEINPAYLELCLNFLILFSRFEFAIREFENFRQNKAIAQASLEKYVASISKSFDSNQSEELLGAVNFILQDPPKVLMNSNNQLIWVNDVVGGSIEIQLLEYIRRIRNSLMHGGKFYGQITTNARNWRLIESSMLIIEKWIDLNDDVKECFRNFQE